jgi:hypothetical protein
MMLTTIDYYTARIEELTAKIEVLCQPYLRQIEQLDAVPGTGVITRPGRHCRDRLPRPLS